MMEPIRLAGGILVDEKGRLFLMHRTSQGKNQWETPGGKVDAGETDEVTAARELEEELGVKLTLTQKIGEGDFFEGEQGYHYVWFWVSKFDAGQFRFEARFTEAGFFSLEEIKAKKLTLSAGSKRFLELFSSKIR